MYKRQLKLLQEQKKKEREQWYQNIGFNKYDDGKFKTKFLEKFLHNEKVKQLEEEQRKSEKYENVTKAQKYAKFVKEMHWPKVSKLKRQEIEALKSHHDFKNSINRTSQSQNIRYRASSNRSVHRQTKKVFLSA